MTQDWNSMQSELKRLLSSKGEAQVAVVLCLRIHAQLHDSSVGGAENSYLNDLVDGLSEESFKYRAKGFPNTIAWNLWHITRIEDAVTNLLIVEGNQVLTPELLDRMDSPITDTGNMITETGIVDFSERILPDELLEYRYLVGAQTQKVLRQLTQSDLKRKPTPAQLKRLVDEGVVPNKPEAMWLVDFWAKKTVAGLLMMPITRHQIVHLNECAKIKEKWLKTKSRDS